jgi:tRNA A37 threonylcarbamoyladenosine synthetase subunit TsaC/SUA5/YrdC
MAIIDRQSPPSADVVRADAQQAFRIMRSGGVTILPLDVSYAIFGHTARAVERVYALKKRPATKPNGVLGNWDIFTEVMETSQRDRDLVKCITQDHDLPLSVVAPFRADHDWLQTTEFGAIRRSTKQGTMDLLINAGAIQAELTRLSLDACTPLFGSSANISLSGSKFQLDDVEDELKQGVDLALGYGRSRYENRWLIGSTIIELGSWRVLRYGGLYEQQARIIEKTFGVALPPRPDEGASMSLV